MKSMVSPTKGQARVPRGSELFVNSLFDDLVLLHDLMILLLYRIMVVAVVMVTTNTIIILHKSSILGLWVVCFLLLPRSATVPCFLSLFMSDKAEPVLSRVQREREM